MNEKLGQRIGLAAWAALAVLQVVWHAWLLPPAHTSVFAAMLIALLPLALPLVYWRTPRRALLLVGMISLFYFCHGVVAAWAAPHERAFAWIEIAFVVVLVLSQARMPKRRRLST